MDDKSSEISKTDIEFYTIAKIAAKKCNGREIVTWINSPRFNEVLKKYFGLSVAFAVSKRSEICDGKKIRNFNVLSPAKYYLVIIDRGYDESLVNELAGKKYVEINDFVFLHHKVVTLENYSCNGLSYSDLYGNTIKSVQPVTINRINFHGCNNHIELGYGLKGGSNIVFDLSNNTNVSIADGCSINASAKFESIGRNGSAEVTIGENCRFTGGLFRLYVSPYHTEIHIDKNTTVETKFEAHANCGKKIIIGQDCMISHNVQFWAGDGHAIFDVESGKNINSDYEFLPERKNVLIIGDHVWVGFNAVIMHGTNIGTGSIVGTSSVVKSVFPNNCAIAGNPAKMIRKNCAWSRNMDAPDIYSIDKKYVSMTEEENIGGTTAQQVQSSKIFDASGNVFSFRNKEKWSAYVKTMLSLDGTKCTGCSACANICPKDAIHMTTDERGFIVPEIDSDKCISCSLCKKTCPKLNLKFPYEVQKNCYAFMASDEIRKVSASGGAFLACAEKILEEGGVVCGAGWTEDFGLRHVIIESKTDLSKIYGSKYAQSSINDVFREIKKYVLSGKKVLFVGTPCQADGLRHYMQRDYQNLYIIDLLCRGVPSDEMFKRYMKESYGDEKILSVVQKSKKRLGWGAYTEIVHASGYTENYNMENNIYMKAFLSDLMFRDSCYGCPYPQKKRVGDISLGDFWQIAKFNKSYDDRLGTSIVIANTEKGKNLIERVQAKLREQVPLDFELPFNSALFTSRKVPAGRDVFFDMIKKVPIGAALDRALFGKKYDIGIVGWWANLNYGGTLTYFALNKAIKDLGYSVMMIRAPHSDATMPNTDTVPMRFARKHYVISRLYAHRDMHLLNYACKGFVSGSDQLWNPYLEQYAGKECFLSFANQNSLRISYASSYGNISSFPEQFIAKYKPELKKFDSVSVREDYGVELSKKYFDVDAQFVCDPVFLCKREDYEELAKQSSCEFPKKFTLDFILDPDEEKTTAIKYVAEKLGVDFSCFTDLQNTELKKQAFKLPDSKIYANHAIEDLVKAYSKCEFVVTDSFHGTCFAIIFNKPFISIANHSRGAKRFESLLRWTGLTDRMVNSVEEIFSKPELLNPINYAAVNEKVAAFKFKSLEWLKAALKKMKY